MKTNWFFFVIISVVCGLLLAGCGNSSDGPRRPVAQQPAAAQPAPPPPEPPKVETVTLTSATPFLLDSSYQSGRTESSDGPDSEPEGNRFRRVVSREQFKTAQYATMIPGGNISPATISKFVRIPPSAFSDPSIKSLNLDDSKLETLDPKGWKLGRITVYVFRSEFSDTSATCKVATGGGEGAGEKTLDELQRSPYFWRIIRSSTGTIYAEPDERGMLGSFSLDGINGYLAYHKERGSHEGNLDAVKENPEKASHTIFYEIMDDYKQYAEAFDALPDAIKGPFIDNAVRLGKPYATEKLGTEVLNRAARKYLLNITWQQVLAADPVKGTPCRWWPHDRENVVVPHYGYDGRTCSEMYRVWLFWQRRGQFAFERTKAAVARELGSSPSTAPAATGTRRSR